MRTWMENSLKLNIPPDWSEIENIRNAGIHFLETHGFSKDLIHSLTMILSELVENSIKYGYFAESDSEVLIYLDIDKSLITIEVKNPVDGDSTPHLKRLDKTIQWIRGYQDSFQAYIEKLREISKKPLEDEESGLGLTRIAYEGKAILDFFVLDNTLNVSTISKYGR
jgi:hypothetical protein